jgi:amidase
MIKHASTRLAAAFALTTALVSAIPASAKTVEFDQATIVELEAAMAAGTLTAEKLTQLCLDRIQTYDRAGPKLHAIITLNPKAVETARALDAERKAKGPRSPLHGIPVVLKDNYDTFDMQTTGGSVLLAGNVPPDDAVMVKKLRDAGAIILAKVNLGEFANGSQSSMGGQSLNPHDLTRTPAGSSGGTGVAIAAGYTPLGFGTDTGGSIRAPSSVNGIVGLKPTTGLASRNGIIPLGLSLDTGGPMARSVSDIAVALGIVAGVDPADPLTKNSEGKIETDYTKFLTADALKGARIGLARDFMGADPDVDWIIEDAVIAMKKAGATVIDVRFPKWFLESDTTALYTLFSPEFVVQLGDYLKAKTGPGYPKSLAEMIERSRTFVASGPEGGRPNPLRWRAFVERDAANGTMDDPNYKALHDYYKPMTTALVNGMLAKDKLDAIIYPTGMRRPALIAAPPGPATPTVSSPTSVASLAGFPDLVVPAGFTTDDLPVTISFMGTAYSEPRLLALGYSFEQATHALRRPVNTPALPNAGIEVPGE